MPQVVQPFVVVLAGAVPFIEGEGGSPIGVINPLVAGLAAAAGNFLAVLGRRHRHLASPQRRGAAAEAVTRTVTASIVNDVIVVAAVLPRP